MAANEANDIPARQNSPEVLDYQAAAKALYRLAEWLFYASLFLGVIVPVLWAMGNLVLAASSVWSSEDRISFAAWGALYGLVIILLDELAFDQWQQTWKRDAATAQEMFDTSLFALDWRSTKVGAPLDVADVHLWAKRWRRVDPSFSKVRDWYPAAVGCAPIHFARLLCQRASLWWDLRLRQQYGLLLGIFAAVLAFLAVAVVKYLGLDVNGLLLAVSTLAPAFRWAIRERRRQLAAAASLDRLCTRVGDLHDGILVDRVDVGDAERQSRELQDDIFDHRRSVPIGHSWLYGARRPDFETAMQASAAQSVAQYRTRHGLPPCDQPA